MIYLIKDSTKPAGKVISILVQIKPLNLAKKPFRSTYSVCQLSVCVSGRDTTQHCTLLCRVAARMSLWSVVFVTQWAFHLCLVPVLVWGAVEGIVVLVATWLYIPGC